MGDKAELPAQNVVFIYIYSKGLFIENYLVPENFLGLPNYLGQAHTIFKLSVEKSQGQR